MKNSKRFIMSALLAISLIASFMMMSCSSDAMKTSMNPAQSTTAAISTISLSGEAIDYDNVQLNWSFKGTLPANDFWILYELDNYTGEFIQCERIAATTLSTIVNTDNLVGPFEQGFTYTFYIGSSSGVSSNQLNIEIPNSIYPAPTNISATAQARGAITVNWNYSVDEGHAGIIIKRSVAGSPYVQVGDVPATATSYTTTGLNDNTSYSFKIYAYGHGGNSLFSNIATAKTVDNIGKSKTASAATYQSANPAKNGNDGSTTTRWCASSGSMTSQWYKIDLGSTKSISDVEIMFEKAGVGTDCNDFTIETSANNSTWTTKVNKATNTTTAQTQKYNFAATSARYVRITIKDAPGTAWASLYEFRVFGK